MRKLAALAAAFSAGIFLCRYALPIPYQLPLGVLFWFLAVSGRHFLPGNAGRRALLAGMGLALALGWNWLYVRQVQQPMEALDGTERTVVMTLCGDPTATDYGARATVRMEGFAGKAVYYGSNDLLQHGPGETVRDTVQLQSAARIRDDDVTAFTSKGVFLLAYQRGEAVYGPGSSASPRWWPLRLCRAMQETIRRLFPGDAAGFLTAILTGDRTTLSVGASAALSEAGLSHILAVSGMHCGFLLALVTVVTGAHRRRLTALAGIPVLCLYALLTGASPSVLRACCMLSFFLLAPLFGRESDGPTSLFAALAMILIQNPFAAASVSLQLSFAAMAGILFLTPRLYRMLAGEKPGRVRRFLAAGASSALGALVFTAPLSGWYFGTLTLIAPLSGILCLWAASGVFMLGLAAVLAGLFCLPLGQLLAVVPTLLTRYILAVAGLLSKIPFHAVYFCQPYLSLWLVFAYALFFTAWLRRGSSRRTYALAAVLTCLTLAVTVNLGQRQSAGLDGKMLDVGQGQCVLLASGGEFTLVDCGSANSWYSPGEIAARYLRAMGCRKLDRLILTHYDEDHCSGVEELLARMDVKTLLVPQAAEEDNTAVLALAESRNVQVQTVTDKLEIPAGRAVLTVYPPVGSGESNERGLSVLATSGEDNLLITGDMNKATERALLEAWPLPDIEVLAVGHHGSRYSTSGELLDALSPEYACISVGANRYGHPADETLRVLAEHGCAIYRTDWQGSIHFTLNRGN